MKAYFSHDEGARNDPKLVAVLMELGHEGKSVYWDLVEMLYEQGGYLELAQCRRYAFALHTHCDLILQLVNEFGLFAADGEKFWSETALERMKMRDAKKQARADAGAKGGKVKAEKEAAAKALLQQSPSNAIAKASNAIAIKRNEMKRNTSNDVAPLPAEDLKAKLSNDLTARLAALTDTSGEVRWNAGILNKPEYFARIAGALTKPETDFEHYRKAALIVAEADDSHRTIKGWESWVVNYFTNQLQRGPLLNCTSGGTLPSQATPYSQYPEPGHEQPGQVFYINGSPGDQNQDKMAAAARLKHFPAATIVSLAYPQTPYTFQNGTTVRG